MSDMWAAIASDTSGRLDLERIAIPSPHEGEILVRVLGSGVCHSDLHVLKDEVKFPRPAVLGHEVMGEVITKVDADGNYPEINPGDRIVSSFIMPCRNCERCRNGQSNICSQFFFHNRLNGNMLDGTKRLVDSMGRELASYSMAGFAEYVVVPLSAVARLPVTLTQPEWCVLGCAGLTAYSAVMRAIQSRKTSGASWNSATIIGLGGVGMFITLFCKILGIEQIVAIDLDQQKLLLAKDLGATCTIDGSRLDAAAIRAELPDNGTHLVFEAVGSSQTIELAMNLLLEGGLVTAVGIAAHGNHASIEITPLVRREFTLKGSFGGIPEEDLRAVISYAEKGEIPVRKLVTRTYQLSEINDAFTRLSNKETIGRSIVTFPERE